MAIATGGERGGGLPTFVFVLDIFGFGHSFLARSTQKSLQTFFLALTRIRHPGSKWEFLLSSHQQKAAYAYWDMYLPPHRNF